MTDVFISYSRRNLDFVLKLANALRTNGKEVWFDQSKEPLQGLPPFSEWWEEIKYGIEAADNFLFVISPESVVSPYCNAEIAHALAKDTRIVTVLYRGESSDGDVLEAIDEAIDAIRESEELPPTVSADITKLQSLTRRNWLKISGVNYLAFSEDEDFNTLLGLLIQGLDLDIAWRRLWSQVRQAAQIWAETGDDGDLWSETRLKPIRQMVEERGQELTDLEREFIRSEYDRLWEEINAPVPVFDSDDDRRRYHQRRAAIGDRLDGLGDCQRRPGVGVVIENLPPLPSQGDEPMLVGKPAPVDASPSSRDMRLWGDKPEHLGLPDIVWLPVEGGKTKVVKIKNVPKSFTVEPFLIAKYPITYVQFQAFLDAEDGFHNPAWWKGLLAYKDHKSQPGQQSRPTDNHPREMVSWYDAIAFCRWLSARLELPQLPTELTLKDLTCFRGVRLPTEWEWQWAAQGSDGRKYPWGPEWEGEKANTRESGLGRTTMVGMYPAGAAPCGALDMSGNVFEWCLNEYRELENVGLAGSKARSRRGGAWRDTQDLARVTVDLSKGQSSRFDINGFRLAVACPPSQ